MHREFCVVLSNCKPNTLRPLASLVVVGAAVSIGGCSANTAYYDAPQMATGSLPAPREGMVQVPERPYGDGYSLGRTYVPPKTGASQGQYQWNGNTTRMQEGTAPPNPPARPVTAADGQRMILVRPGDTLYSIARQHGVTVAGLAAVNRLASSNVSAGQTLVLPATVR